MRPTLKRRELLVYSVGGLLVACGGVAAPSPAAPGASAPTPPTSAPASLKVRLGSVSVSAANAAIWSAEDGGFLRKYGLDAQVSNVADSTQAVAALLAGEIPLNCGISGTAVVASVLQGSDLVIIASTVNTFPSSLYAKSSVTSIAGLRGGKVGVSRFGTASDTAARIALKQGGLDPAKDVTLLQLGGLNEILAAMQSGQVDAGALSPPQTVLARNAGFRELIDVGALGIPYVYNGVATSRSYATKNAEIVDATLKALIEGEHRFKTDAEWGKSIVAARTKLTDPSQVEETWRLFAMKYLQEPPFPTDAALKTVLDELAPTQPKAQSASPGTFYDDSYLRKLDASGFIKSITR